MTDEIIIEIIIESTDEINIEIDFINTDDLKIIPANKTIDLINHIKTLNHYYDIVEINIYNNDADVDVDQIVDKFDVDAEKINY